MDANDPKLGVVVCAYNEHFLLPHFFRHYAFADRIIVLADRDQAIPHNIPDDPRIEVRELNFANGFSDRIKIEAMTTVAHAMTDCDWVLYADADELLWPEGDPLATTVKDVLKYISPRDNVVRVGYKNVYRHVTDKDLTLDEVPVMQRRHGIKDPLPGYLKPALVRPQSKLTMNLGHHSVEGRHRLSPIKFAGSHWAYAEPVAAVERVIRNRIPRLSAENRRNNWGVHLYGQTEETVRQHCRDHENDPLVVI